MKKIIFLIMTGFIFLALSLAVAADIPMMLNYQGYVEYGDGVPVNGTGFFKFAIVDPNGNTAYWSNDGTSTTGDEPNSAVPITVTNGIFAIKLGNTDMTNMSTALPTNVFEQQNIYVRVWFSDDETNFELLEPDTQIVSTGFAYKAQTVVDGASYSWSELTEIPEGFADGNDNIGITSETDPTVLASVKDGVSWLELTKIPVDIKDGDDVGITTESDPTVLGSVKDGVSWSELTEIPDDIANGDDIGITGVTAGTGLSGGGTSGNITLHIASNGIGSDQIKNESISNVHIDNTANIDINKILGDVGISYKGLETSFFSGYLGGIGWWGPQSVNIDPNMSTLKSLVLNAPKDGYALILHNGYCLIGGDNTEVLVGIGRDETSFITVGYSFIGSNSASVNIGNRNGSGTDDKLIPYNVMAVVPISEAGSHDFYSLARMSSSYNTHSATIYPKYLIALFIPKSY